MKSLSADDIERAIADMAGALRRLPGFSADDAVMVGVQTGGYWIAERLHQLLALREPLGSLSTRLYRDDFNKIGLHGKIQPSNVPAPIEKRCVIVVDDVLGTGRTARAAMNELFDYGRPASIRLAVLVDRNGRELPISPDVVGRRIKLPPGQYARLSGPSPLRLDIHERAHP